jgi:serine/threonine protein kinase
MKVTLFHCGPAANDSELKGFEYLKSRLLSEAGDDHWILLTNLTFSVTHQLQSDEIDLVAIGPSGVRVIEIKHWTTQWCEAHKTRVENEAERVTNKARKIGTTLRRALPELPHVDGAILLTQDPSAVKRMAGQQVRGVSFHALNDWKALIGFDAPRVLSARQVAQLANILQPRSRLAIDGSLRRLAGYVNLELQTPKTERFHRVYKGSHPARRDRVVLHLYDLSASDDKNAAAKAKREYEVLHRLQLYPWAPRILDSYQEAPEHEGEMFFFTVVDPAAPSIEERATDMTWTTESRLTFARNTVRALAQFHAAETATEPLVHRNLTPQTILVKFDNSPILTGFERTKIPLEVSVASCISTTGQLLATSAPEVITHGLTVADQQSDIYSLCKCLSHLLDDRSDKPSERAVEVLAQGLAEKPSQRITVEHLAVLLSELLGESAQPPPPPPARFWTEDQIIRFRDRDYRIVSRLGSGGIGTAFKVVELDRLTKEELGTYVAKVVHEGETGQRVLKAYSLVKSHLRHTALSTIFEVARQWEENEFVALMSWISGAPLAEFSGVFPLLAEENHDTSSEALALRWMRDICEGLDVLHRNGLIHGDVSPRNLIVSDSELVLTDYDFATRIGESILSPGTILYCSPSYQEKRVALPSDDIYALASSFFRVVFDREPFRHGHELNKNRGLNWEGVNCEEYPVLVAFLNKATSPNSQMRFTGVAEAVAALSSPAVSAQSFAMEGELVQGDILQTEETPTKPPSTVELQEQRIEWLHSLLQSYPGSRWGNRETRGLDTDFAAQTYVETLLERTLLRDIHERRVRLVILCGNAGDGKTALLQHLAARLGLGNHQSNERILEGQVPDGPLIRMNLDGSAAWQGRSADEILDDFLEPFQDGPPRQDIVHLLAINDGRLLEWVEEVQGRRGSGETPLTMALAELLQEEAATLKSHIRFVSLNKRSLVGGVTPDGEQIDTAFLERLVDQLYGGERAAEIWSPCQTCSAKNRCEVYRAARYFGPQSIPGLVEPAVRSRVRERLYQALQAVHLSGETHITIRELRAALVYIMFGVHFCDDYHGGVEETALPYWDRAFQADSLFRQGEVLAELARYDPALEAHPQIDRYLLSRPTTDSVTTAPHYPQMSRASARRRAFFEWLPEEIEQVAESSSVLDLARGQHLRQFRDLPLVNSELIAELCERLCRGISRLEDLPLQALERPNVVPLRIAPRTPTETAFWVEKPLGAFRLEADLRPNSEGVEILHRQAFLVYRYRHGKGEERLRLGAELFHLLLELADGYQLGDISSDDTFAHLSIFVQRLVREDERELLAWTPVQDEMIYRVSAVVSETDQPVQQRMMITPLASGVDR